MSSWSPFYQFSHFLLQEKPAEFKAQPSGANPNMRFIRAFGDFSEKEKIPLQKKNTAFGLEWRRESIF